MDPSNSDRGQNPNSGIAAAGITAALGFTARQLAYVQLYMVAVTQAVLAEELRSLRSLISQLTSSSPRQV